MKVKLSNYPRWPYIKTEVDGKELLGVVAIKLECEVDALPRLTVVMNAHNIDVELNADVTVVFNLFDDEDIEITKMEDGRQRVRKVKK